MKPLVWRCVGLGLGLAISGCGASESRVWNGPRLRSGGYVLSPNNAPPVDPGYAPAPMRQPAGDVAPPVRPGDLEPMPTPALKLEENLPAPPSEQDESVQFFLPVPPSSMPNALDPVVNPRPILEQSSAERPAREPSNVLGEGKIAAMRGHSTCPDRSRSAKVRLLQIEPDHAPGEQSQMMQVHYLPLLAPVPSL